MANVKYVVDLSEEEEQQLRKFISRSKVVELGFAESICHEIVRQILKKTTSSPGNSTSGVPRR